MPSYFRIIEFVLYAIFIVLIVISIRRSSKNSSYKQIKEKFPDISEDKLFVFQEVTPKNLPTWKGFLSLKSKKINFYYLYICENKAQLFNLNKEGEIESSEYTRENSRISRIKNNDLFPGFGSYISFNKDGERLVLGSSTSRNKTINSIIEKLEKILPTEVINFNSEKIESKSKKIRFVLYSLLLIAGGVLYYATKNTPTNNTPHTLAQLNDNSILVASDSKIVHLDEEGNFIETILNKDLGIKIGIAGIKEDTSGDLLIGDFGNKTIKVCDPGDWTCKDFIDLNSENNLVCRSYLFDIDKSNSNIFVTDVSRHRVLEFDTNANLIKTHFSYKELCYPNEISFVDNNLALTNTNHNKIQIYDIKSSQKPILVKEFLTVEKGRKAVNCPKPGSGILDECPKSETTFNTKNKSKAFESAGEGRVWPINVAKDAKGNWWIINSNNGFVISDLLRFNEDGKEHKVIISEKNKYPMFVLPRKNDVIALTLGELGIMRFNFEGNYIGNLGDDTLKNEFLDISSKKNKFQLSIYTIILCIILLFVIFCIISLMLLPVERLKYFKD